MLGVAFMIFISGLAVWTIPDSVTGTVREGAMMVIALQGMAFNIIGICYAIRYTIRNWAIIKQVLKEVCSDAS